MVYDRLATCRDYAGKNSISLVDSVFSGTSDGIDYVKVEYMGEIKNLKLHYEVYPEGKSPYNQGTDDVPYIVIKKDVYPLSKFITVGFKRGVGM